MSVYIFPKSLNVYINVVQLFIIYKLYLNKAGKKEITCLEMCLAHSKHSIILTVIIPDSRKQCLVHGRHPINMHQSE